MKRNSYLVVNIFLSLVFVRTLCLNANEAPLCSSIEKSKIGQSGPVNFDKKRYNDLIKKILHTKSPSFSSRAASKICKEFCYLCTSGLIGTGIAMNVGEKGSSALNVTSFLFGAVLAHTLMQVLFDYLFVSKDQNLQNLEDFEKYVQETLSSEEYLIKNNSDLILKLFEKDYDLISNKLDQDQTTGFLRKIIRFIFKESIVLLESGAFGVATGLCFSDGGTNLIGSVFAGSASGITYFILITILFEVLLAGNDQHLLKIEKFRDINQLFEEIKIKKLDLQKELVIAGV
jgi:hypothetical protein